ncbi:MAG TPA: folate-binding protein [Pseudonocardia sp.]|uniref:CAF17-like 4Fe-4S cluster assembly/insertion protein YgfZ n=1 Tax=Pseudonocardia sp. TaxID=60912 RepID=UPI002F409321
MNPLLTLPRVVAAEDGPDAGLPAHHGDPLAEQRAMDRSAAVVDRSNREVIAVPGEDRLTWLHLLLSQHVSELPPGAGTEALVLDLNGRVEYHAVLAHTDDTVWLDMEPGTAEGLLDYLEKMRFWSKVAPRAATDELALLSVVGPSTPEVLAKAGVPVPAQPYDCAALPGGGLVRRMPGPGRYAADVLVPRAEVLAWWTRLRGAGAAAAGVMAYEALRVEALRPRLGVDTDEKTIPHEVGWIGKAVHLAKGCYRGQETVARVANLGRPPRQLVLLHTESGDDDPLRPGDPVLLGGRTVGRVGTAVLHHELGGVALALLKRSVPVDSPDLTAGLADDSGDRSTGVRVDPSSVPPPSNEEPAGRAAQAKTRARSVRR